jgi:ABC-type transport system involved in cytochrome c biogenesis permease subunit
MPKWALAYFGLTLVVMAYGFYAAMVAPKEATMGNLYRVFFYHLPHTILSFVFPYLNCGASFLYLYWRNRNVERAAAADAFALASAEITVLYASIGLATGMLWGRAAWGIWWAWDARMTTYLLLWLLYVSYLLVRQVLRYRPDGRHLRGARHLRCHRRSRSALCRSAGGARSIPRPSSAAATTPASTRPWSLPSSGTCSRSPCGEPSSSACDTPSSAGGSDSLTPTR